jgi:hypothetical protein
MFQGSKGSILMLASNGFLLSYGLGRANFRRRHRYPYAPDSNPGKTPADRREAQKALL